VALSKDDEKKLMLKMVCTFSEVRCIYPLSCRGDLTETNVAGRKARVTTAMVFMEALSR
jgi:hypothetical protein